LQIACLTPPVPPGVATALICASGLHSPKQAVSTAFKKSGVPAKGA